MNLRPWITNPIIIFALIEFVILAGVVALVLLKE